jgi:Flp pilus assembly protein TadG
MRPLASLLRFGRNKRGAALIEFSLFAPVLVLMMCGLAEFGSAMRQYHLMEKGVRDAGRYMARMPMTGCALTAGRVTEAQNLAITGRITGGTPLLSTWSDPATVGVTVSSCFDNSAGTYRGHPNMPVIQVTATAPYVDLGLLSILGFDNTTLSVTHRQLWIGE